MSFKEAMDSVTEDLLREEAFGETILYQPEGGDAFELQALWDEETEVVNLETQVPATILSPRATVRRSDLLSAPKVGSDTVIKGSVLYKVRDYEPDYRGLAVLHLHKV